MSNRIAGAIVATVASCVVASTVAATGDPPLETLIVTATRNPTPLTSVLAPATVIDRETLARSLAPDITDVLRFDAGLDVARTGGPGQPTSVFIRGAESNHTLVLVDGVRMNPGTIGSAALQNIPPELVERIEIVRGPRSTLYGTDAIGGVINVITRRAPPGGRFEARAGAGSYDSRQASVVTSLAADMSEIGAAVSWLDSDGFPTRSTDATDRGFDNLAVNLHARASAGAFDLAVRHVQAEGTSEYSDFFLTPVDQDFRNAITSGTVDFAGDGPWSARVTLSRMADQIEQNDSPDHLETERYALDWQNDFEFERHRVTAGILLQHEDAESLSFGTGFDASTRMTSAYVQDWWLLGPHSLLLAAGYTDHETFGGHPTWNVEYGHALGERTRLTMAAGTAFRAPDATDLYGFAGNAALDPEESRSIELGLRHDPAERHSLTLSVFQNDIDDLIEFVVVDPVTFDGRLENVESARIRGVEAGYAYTGADWQLRAQVSVQDPENRSTGARLLRRTRESVTVGATRSFGPVAVGLDVLYAGAREDFGFPEPTRLSAYTLANLTASYQLSRSFSVLARVENLLDEDYELASTYNTPDRSVFFAVRYQSP